MAHMMKATRGAARGLLMHDERKAGEPYVRSNIDIDPARTHLNYSLIEQPTINEHCGFNKITANSSTFDSYLKSFVAKENIHLLNRKDVNVLCCWTVTAPKGLTEEETTLFFQKCNEFLIDRYGYNVTNGTALNVVSSIVHMDETTPHLHFKIIPVGYDKKNDRYTVSAKLVTDRKDLQTFHQDLDKFMTKIFGRDIGVLNGATDENRTVRQIKAEGGQLEQANLSLKKENELLEQKKQYLTEDISHLEPIVSEIKQNKPSIGTRFRKKRGKLANALTNSDSLPELKVFDRQRYDEKGNEVTTIEVDVEQLKEVQQQCLALRAAFGELEEEKKKLLREQTEVELQKKEIEEQQQALAEKKSTLKGQIKYCKNFLANAFDRESKLEEREAAVIRREESADVKTLRSTIGALEQTIISLKSELEHMADENNKKDERIDKLKEQNTKLKANIENRNSWYSKKIDGLNEKMFSLNEILLSYEDLCSPDADDRCVCFDFKGNIKLANAFSSILDNKNIPSRVLHDKTSCFVQVSVRDNGYANQLFNKYYSSQLIQQNNSMYLGR